MNDRDNLIRTFTAGNLYKNLFLPCQKLFGLHAAGAVGFIFYSYGLRFIFACWLWRYFILRQYSQCKAPDQYSHSSSSLPSWKVRQSTLFYDHQTIIFRTLRLAAVDAPWQVSQEDGERGSPREGCTSLHHPQNFQSELLNSFLFWFVSIIGQFGQASLKTRKGWTNVNTPKRSRFLTGLTALQAISIVTCFFFAKNFIYIFSQ